MVAKVWEKRAEEVESADVGWGEMEIKKTRGRRLTKKKNSG